MPIPSLNQALKPRQHIIKTTNGPSVAESSRLAQTDNARPTSDTLRFKPSGNATHANGASLTAKDVDVKRRSFLPQRGEAKQLPPPKTTDQVHTKNERSLYTIQDSSSASTPVADMQSTKQRLRPRSLYQVRANRSEHSEGSDETQAQSLRAPHGTSKLAQTQTAGLNRSQSFRKSSAQTQQKSDKSSNAPSHTRAQSGTITARTEEAEPRLRLARPKSLYAASSNGATTTLNNSVDIGSSDAKPSVRSAAPTRSASTRTKPDVVGGSNSTSQARSDQHSMAQRRELRTEESKKPMKPAFSTLQQHFTPRKGGKAPTSMFLHPPVQDVGPHVLPPELFNVQAQLLQFHLMHQASAKTTIEWERSAMKGLRDKFDQVASFYEAMRDNERQDQEQKNLQALRDWTTGNASCSVVEHIQLLSGPLHEIPSLLEPGGRLGRLAEDFDSWLVQVQARYSARPAKATRRAGRLESAGRLGDSWKSENASLTRKMTSFQGDLDRLSQITPGSSTACIVAACRELLGLILDELQTMRVIEADVAAAEQEWVEAQLRAVDCDMDGQMMDSLEDVAWRS